jgi:hypothetical protein
MDVPSLFGFVFQKTYSDLLLVNPIDDHTVIKDVITNSYIPTAIFLNSLTSLTGEYIIEEES